MAETYDVIAIGGGLAGAALAKRLAENGVRVLVLDAKSRSATACAASRCIVGASPKPGRSDFTNCCSRPAATRFDTGPINSWAFRSLGGEIS